MGCIIALNQESAMRHAHNAVNHEVPAHRVFESHNRAQSYPSLMQ